MSALAGEGVGREVNDANIPGAPDWAKSLTLQWQFYEPLDGDFVTRQHPFTRMQGPCWSDWDKGLQQRWRPGVWDTVYCYPDNMEPTAHGMGEVRIRVVQVAKLPKPYPRRIFYTRQFVDPDGREYRKSGLLVHGITRFRQVCGPFKQFGYTIDADRDPVPDEHSLHEFVETGA